MNTELTKILTEVYATLKLLTWYTEAELYVRADKSRNIKYTLKRVNSLPSCSLKKGETEL